MKNLLLLLAVFVLCSCAGAGVAPTQNQQQTAIPENIDYGLPPPDNYQEVIKASLEQTLFDSESARYKFDEPCKASVKVFTPDTYSAKVFFQSTIAKMHCWAVPVKINAKNRYGAYVGWKDEVFFFKGDHLLSGLDVVKYELIR